MLMHHHFMCWPNVDTRPSIHAGVCSVWGLGSLGAAWAQEEVLWQLRWEIQMRSNGGRSHNWFIHQHNTTHFRYLLYLPSTIYSDHSTEMWLAFVHTMVVFHFPPIYEIYFTLVLLYWRWPQVLAVSRAMVRYTLRWAWCQGSPIVTLIFTIFGEYPSSAMSFCLQISSLTAAGSAFPLSTRRKR